MKKILIIMFILMISPFAIYGTEINGDQEVYSESQMLEQLDMLNFDQLQQELENNEATKDIDFKQFLIDIVTGNVNLSIASIFTYIGDILFSELREFGGLMQSLLIICILSAILRNLTESFKNKGVGELGFYVCYMILIIIIFKAFSITVGISKGLIETLTLLMEALIPLMLTLVVMAGNIGANFVFSPTLTLMVNVTTIFINNFLVPLILLGAVMEIVNYLTEKEILTNFSKLIKSICTWVLKSIVFIFLTLLTLQKIASPIMTTFMGKAAKSTISVIPVVGDVLNGAVDMLAYWADAVKSGALVAIVIIIIILCVIPILKLVATILILKFTSAVIQPICDERIVECIDSMGNYSSLLLWCCITVSIMFTLSVVILLSF